MRALTIIACALLAACGHTVTRPDQVETVTEHVTIPQREYVRVPDVLTEALPVYVRTRETPGEWWSEAEHNTAQLQRCVRDRAATALLSGQPVDGRAQ